MSGGGGGPGHWRLADISRRQFAKMSTSYLSVHGRRKEGRAVSRREGEGEGDLFSGEQDAPGLQRPFLLVSSPPQSNGC